MSRNRRLSVEQARKLVEQWHGMAEDHIEHQRLTARFADAGPSQVIDMWDSGLNEKGKPLSKVEVQALGERWCEIFETLPPPLGVKASPGIPQPPAPSNAAR